MEEIKNKKFKVERIIWYSQQTRWGVLATKPLDSLDGYEVDLMNDFSNVCMSGNFDGVFQGAEITVSGDIVTNPKYGKQIQIRNIKVKQDTKSKEGVVNFLAKSFIKGISVANANKIYDKFQDQSIKIVLNYPDKLASIFGIGDKTVEKVRDSVKQYKTKEAFIDYCANLGLMYTTIIKLDEALGDEALSIIQTDPYKVLEVTENISFNVVDEIYINNGGSPRSIRRLMIGLLHILKKTAVMEGSTGCYSISLKKRFLKLLGFEDREENLYWETLTKLKYSGQVVMSEVKGKLTSHEVVFYKPYLDMEERIAGALHILEHEGNLSERKIFPGVIESEIKDFSFVLNKQQVKAIKECLKHNVTVITGCAGSGKSSITKAIYNIYKRSDYNVKLLAPTAKACRRLEECTEGEAQTLHKFVGMNKDGKVYNSEGSYPPNTVLIIDEASMMDIILFDLVLQRISLDTKVILVGDNNQLPSVQAGNVLGDVIASGDVYVATLTDVVRQQEDSNIIKFCKLINDGTVFDPCELEDFHYEEFGTAEELRDVLFPAYEREVSKYGLNEVQVIAPYKQGELGMNNLNIMLQNKYQEKIKGPMAIEPYRLGDKVRHTQNNYDKDVYNGETGVVMAVNDEVMTVDFGYKERDYEGAELDELTLSFASTVHASQGSEYKVVFVILDDTATNSLLHIRRLLYTAVSRGKKKVYILTKPFLLDRCIENNSYRPRVTKLKEFLEELKNSKEVES